MSLAKRAVWIVERNLNRPLTLETLAAACGVSPFHLCHAFAAATGAPLMRYLRGRRLSHAAESLAGGADDILDLALASGYASHAAFTRAFKAAFGVTPAAVRRRGSVEGLPLVAPLDPTVDARPAQPRPRLVDAGELTLIGLSAEAALDAPQVIVDLWRRFGPRYLEIEQRIEAAPLGLLGPPDVEGRLTYACAAVVEPSARPPPGMVRFRQQGGRYAVFEHAGHVSRLRGAYAAIWDEALPAAGLRPRDLPVLERHKPAFDPLTGEGGLEIWVPVEAAIG